MKRRFCQSLDDKSVVYVAKNGFVVWVGVFEWAGKSRKYGEYTILGGESTNITNSTNPRMATYHATVIPSGARNLSTFTRSFVVLQTPLDDRR